MILSPTFRSQLVAHLARYDADAPVQSIISAIEQASGADDAVSRVAELMGEEVTEWDVSQSDGGANGHYVRRNPDLHFRMVGDDCGERTLVSYNGHLRLCSFDDQVDDCCAAWETHSGRTRCEECGEWADGGTSGCCRRDDDDDDEPNDSHATDARRYRAERSARLASYV